MNIAQTTRTLAACAISFAALAVPAAAQQVMRSDFSNETVGAEPDGSGYCLQLRTHGETAKFRAPDMGAGIHATPGASYTRVSVVPG